MSNNTLRIPTSQGTFIERSSEPNHPTLVLPRRKWSLLAKLFFLGTPACLFSLIGLMAYYCSLPSRLFLVPISLIITEPTTMLIILEAAATLGLTCYLWSIWLFRVPAEDCVDWMIKEYEK